LIAQIILGDLADGVRIQWAQGSLFGDGQVGRLHEAVFVRGPDHQDARIEFERDDCLNQVELNADVVDQGGHRVLPGALYRSLGRQVKDIVGPDCRQQFVYRLIVAQIDKTQLNPGQIGFQIARAISRQANPIDLDVPLREQVICEMATRESCNTRYKRAQRMSLLSYVR
jgi:hypothetical protein